MSGAVDSAKDIVKIGASPMYAPVLAVKNLVQGKSIGASIGGAFKPAVQSSKNIIGGVAGGIADEKPLPSVVQEDPAEVDKANKQARARARRQAEVDILTDRPGRGGTLLTDSFQYKV